MDITLEQARAFEATHRLGTIQKAAKSLGKGHSAILYLIKSIEAQVGFELFDRRGYRNQISPKGQIVLKFCQKLLATTQELEMACENLRSGWEPSLTLIYDGVVDFNLIGEALLKLNKSQVPTEVKIVAAYLNEVEKKFVEERGSLMVTVLPIQLPNVISLALEPIRMLLVAHSKHELSESKREKISTNELAKQTYIKVRETSGQLGLSTEHIEFSSSFLVNDFSTKKMAIAKGLGFGWLPEYLIKKEIKSGLFIPLNTEIKNEHHFRPKIFYRNEELTGRTTSELIRFFS